jgi:hypothetical protein
VEDGQQDQQVSRDQFKRLSRLSAPETVPPPPRRWSDNEWAAICRGHQSRDMDDKWNAFVENDRLFLHRSWTGLGVYEAQFTRSGDTWGPSPNFSSAAIAGTTVGPTTPGRHCPSKPSSTASCSANGTPTPAPGCKSRHGNWPSSPNSPPLPPSPAFSFPELADFTV